MQYQECLSHTCDTGDFVNIDGNKWDCVIPCIVIGWTDDGVPVLQMPGGPKLCKGELVPPHTLRTKGKPGQTPTEVMALGKYLEIHPKYLVGEEILYSHFAEWQWLIITADQRYLKLGPVSDTYDGTIRIELEDLTLRDLSNLGLLDEEMWEQHEREVAAMQDAQEHKQGKRELDGAIAKLGLPRVEAIVQMAVDSKKV